MALGYFVFSNTTTPSPTPADLPVYNPCLSIQLWTEWSGKSQECGEGIRNYILCEVACLEVWQGDRDSQLMLGIMSKSHLTQNQMDHTPGTSGWEWRVVGVRGAVMALQLLHTANRTRLYKSPPFLRHTPLYITLWHRLMLYLNVFLETCPTLLPWRKRRM